MEVEWKSYFVKNEFGTKYIIIYKATDARISTEDSKKKHSSVTLLQ